MRVERINTSLRAPSIQHYPGLLRRCAPRNDSVHFSGNTINEEYFQLKGDAKSDVFQQAAAKHLQNGQDVIVTAPTGTGKTAIALYAVTKNLEEGKKTYYTTPLKALSNEKYRDFQKIFGEENVGLLTGDTKINANAPIVLMTTEIYKNMAAAQGVPRDVSTVIFDELHYLGDVDRGGVWEQSIMFTPKDVQILSLSATIGNNKEVTDWMSKVKDKQVQLVDVPPENRHVPLSFLNEIVQLEGKNISTKSYIDLTKKLKEKQELPAIYFIFSKNGSRKVLEGLTGQGPQLVSHEERKQIDKIIKSYKDKGIYLGETLNISGINRGYAIHNAGMLPAQKQLIEELFQKKLLKVVIATETLSAGINMPAKTTVITSLKKPASDTNGRRPLTPNEFHQMAGRAGRRGIDTKGLCITLSPDKQTYNEFSKLVESPPNTLESAFAPDYSFVANHANNPKLQEIFEKSFYAYNNEAEDLRKNFDEKLDFLKQKKYINPDNTLSDKGKLLAQLNGYEQIPIIEAVYNKKFEGMNAVETASTVAKMANLNGTGEFAQSDAETAAEHVNTWAQLNTNKNNSSEKNWRKMINNKKINETIHDEGTMFKEIKRTIDLLKQLKTIAQTGENFNCKKEEEYYQNLYETLDTAIELLSRPPC